MRPRQGEVVLRWHLLGQGHGLQELKVVRLLFTSSVGCIPAAEVLASEVKQDQEECHAAIVVVEVGQTAAPTRDG